VSPACSPRRVLSGRHNVWAVFVERLCQTPIRKLNREPRKSGIEGTSCWIPDSDLAGLKFAHCPRSLAATLAALPSISEIPFPRFRFDFVAVFFECAAAFALSVHSVYPQPLA